MQIRVYYEDTDMGGIVYHSNYLNFCERARSEFFFQDGSVPLLEGGGFVVASLEAKFKAPSKLGDLLEVKTDVINLRGSSLHLHQCVYRNELLLFDMKIKLAFVVDGKVGRLNETSQEYLVTLFNKYK